MKVRIVNKSGFPDPQYETSHAAGMDLRVCLDRPFELGPLQRHLFKTGLFIELPEGYEAQIRPRSGLAFKKGVTVLNTPGTIDADYRGEIGVILVNVSDQNVIVENGERIAQMVITRHERIAWESAAELTGSERGAGGFGSTGVK